MELVCNTLQFRFPVGASPPSWEEIAEFTKQLNCDVMLMEAVYKLPQGRSLCIKYRTAEAMEEALRVNSEILKFRYSNGKIVDVHMCIAGRNVSYVRVFDLPPEVTDNDLFLVLEKFGKVGSAVREKFPAGLGLDHLHTGVRGVYVEVENEIPPSLQVSGCKTRIFYDGLKGKCFLCNLEGHQRDSCPQRTRKSKDRRKRDPVSYAGIVASGTTVQPADSEQVEEEWIDEENVQSVEEVEESETGQQNLEHQRKEEQEAQQRKEKQEQALAKLTNLMKHAVDKHQASERRAQFAATGSTEMLRPIKSARKSSK